MQVQTRFLENCGLERLCAAYIRLWCGQAGGHSPIYCGKLYAHSIIYDRRKLLTIFNKNVARNFSVQQTSVNIFSPQFCECISFNFLLPKAFGLYAYVQYVCMYVQNKRYVIRICVVT
jgi:hypothetical protein